MKGIDVMRELERQHIESWWSKRKRVLRPWLRPIPAPVQAKQKEGQVTSDE